MWQSESWSESLHEGILFIKEFCERVGELVTLPWTTPSKWHLESVKARKGWRFNFLKCCITKKKKKSTEVFCSSFQCENRQCALTRVCMFYLIKIDDRSYRTRYIKTSVLIFNLEVTFDQHWFISNFCWLNMRILLFFKRQQLSMLFATYK